MLASFRTGPIFVQKKTLFDYFRRSFTSLSNDEFQEQFEHFWYKLPILAGFLTKKQAIVDKLFCGK